MAGARGKKTQYTEAAAYAKLIAPRYAPIADALIDAAGLARGDDVLEVGAGTGLVTERIASRVRSVIATDLSADMLAVARASLDGNRKVVFALLDYSEPFPFLDASFDVVLSGLTYVQRSSGALREVARVLKPKGRLVIAMWGNRYHEHRMLSDALESVGLGRFPTHAPGRAVRRLERLGFRSVGRHDFELTNEFRSVDEYLSYRRGFGKPPMWTRPAYERFLRAVRREASRQIDGDGRFVLGWTITIITARRP